MKLLFDENIERSIVEYFQALGYDYVWIVETDSGTSDRVVLDRARKGKRVLITADLDFGRLVFQQKHAHNGIIVLRLTDQTAHQKAVSLNGVLKQYSTMIPESFVVIEQSKVRIRGARL